MTLSRPLLLALAGAVLVAVAFLATSGMRTGTEPAPPAATPVPSAASAAGDAGSAKKPAPAPGAAAKRKARPARPAGVPVSVARALANHRPVVLFFGKRGPADDAATRTAVRTLRRAKLTVAQADVRHAARYAPVVKDLDLTQVPATVIVDRKGRARVVEGFLDGGSLRQLVSDARG